MRVLLSAFQCSPGAGSEPGNGWHWATALAEQGHDVTVLTTSHAKEAVLAADPQGIDFHFIDVPLSPLHHFSPHLARYPFYLRWQEAAFRHVERTSQQYDVAHHVTLHRCTLAACSGGCRSRWCMARSAEVSYSR